MTSLSLSLSLQQNSSNILHLIRAKYKSTDINLIINFYAPHKTIFSKSPKILILASTGKGNTYLAVENRLVPEK